MNHQTTARFWACYDALPEDARQRADASYRLLQNDPRHPSLHFNKVGRFWSVRVSRSYRALALERDGTLYWFWIGTHAEYDRLLR